MNKPLRFFLVIDGAIMMFEGTPLRVRFMGLLDGADHRSPCGKALRVHPPQRLHRNNTRRRAREGISTVAKFGSSQVIPTG
jgi:hypothetical protein